jgi:hypothetical protein
LKEVTDYNEAVAAHEAEIAHWSSIKRKRAKIAKAQASSALNFLAYLNDYLKEEALWLQWSKAGAIHAAECNGVSVDSIARTNNHLESHNGHIKGKYFESFTHGGRLPRLDHWVQTIVTTVIPEFFEKLADERKQIDYRSAMRCGVPAAPISAERKSEIELLSAHVLADADTEDAHKSDTDTESSDHDTMCDSTLSSSIESVEAAHEDMHSVSHVSDSEIGFGELNLEDSDDLNQDNALDEEEIVAQLCQPRQAPSPSLLNERALIAQEVLSLEDEFVALLKRAFSINMDISDIKNNFFANVNRRINDPEAQSLASSASESNARVSVLPPVEINRVPVDSAEMTRRIGAVLEDLGVDSEDEQILPFTHQKKEQRKAAYGIR